MAIVRAANWAASVLFSGLVFPVMNGLLVMDVAAGRPGFQPCEQRIRQLQGGAHAPEPSVRALSCAFITALPLPGESLLLPRSPWPSWSGLV